MDETNKKIAILTQGGHKENCTKEQRLIFSGRPGIDLYKLNWNKDFNDQLSDYVSDIPVGWSVGRQLLYEIAREKNDYEYYIYLDDDVTMDKKDVPALLDFIDEWNPLCGAVSCFFTPKSIWEWDEKDVSHTKTETPRPCVRYSVHDENHMFLHKSVMETLFPLVVHGNGSMMWFVERFVHDLFNGAKNIRNPNILMLNGMHRSRGIAHGPQRPHDHNRLVDLMRPIYKKEILYKKQEKEFITKTNAKYSNNGSAPSKEFVELTNEKLKTLIDIDSKIWTDRQWLLGEWRGHLKEVQR